MRSVKWALALSGGGAPGVAAHLGFIQGLKATGFPFPDIVVGTSAGGIIAGALGAGIDTDAQASTWTTLARDEWALIPSEVFHLLSSLRKTTTPGLISLSGPIGSLISTHNYKDVETWQRSQLVRSWKPGFAAIVADMNTGIPVVVHQGNDLGLYTFQALIATAAIPVLISGVRTINGHLLQDGGTFDNDPVQAARDLGADRVVLVHIGRSPEMPEVLNIFDLGQLTLGRGIAWGEKVSNPTPPDLRVEIETSGLVLNLSRWAVDYKAGQEAATVNLPHIKAVVEGVPTGVTAGPGITITGK